jgi:hypothetical protein
MTFNFIRESHKDRSDDIFEVSPAMHNPHDLHAALGDPVKDKIVSYRKAPDPRRKFVARPSSFGEIGKQTNPLGYAIQYLVRILRRNLRKKTMYFPQICTSLGGKPVVIHALC